MAMKEAVTVLRDDDGSVVVVQTESMSLGDVSHLLHEGMATIVRTNIRRQTEKRSEP